MKIIITGSLGHISQPLTQDLIKKGHNVTVISRNAEKITDIKAMGATAAIGSVTDLDFLSTTFNGADLVYTMLPPGNFMDPDYDVMAKVQAIMHNYKQAIENANRQRVVHLSSIGAHTNQGNGLLRLHYIAESILRQLPEDIHLTFMRPTGFYYNLYAYIPMIKNQGMIAANYGLDDVAVWVAPADIAMAIAEEIEKPSAASPTIRYVASEELPCSETARILGEAVGKQDLQWIRIPNQQMLDGFISRGMKRDIAEGMVEMYASHATLYDDYYRNRPILGKIKMVDFAKEFAVVYQQ